MADIEIENALESLHKWIIEDGKCVTKTSLLRQTPLNTRQVESVMNKFYEQHKDLSATFVIFGTKKLEDSDSICRQSIICKQENVEEIKEAFEKVISVNVYSLHRNSATMVQTLLNADWSGHYQHPVVPLEDRLHIVCSVALNSIKKWRKTDTKPVYSSFPIPQFMPKVKKLPKPLAKSIIVKSDQHSLKDAFAIAALNCEESEEEDRMEVDEMVPETSKLPSPKKNPIVEDKSSKKKKLQDEEIDSTKSKKPSSKTKETGVEEPTKKQKKDNIFSTEPKQVKPRKSPIKVENVEEEVSSKKKKSLEKAYKMDKPIKKENDDNMTQGSTTKVMKNKNVTETYIDDEGMLVTQVVSKMVESEEPAPSKPSALKTKNTNPKPPQKLPMGQKSISSFFKKI